MRWGLNGCKMRLDQMKNAPNVAECWCVKSDHNEQLFYSSSSRLTGYYSSVDISENIKSIYMKNYIFRIKKYTYTNPHFLINI